MFHVEQSNRLETLAGKLAGHLAGSANLPLVPEIVAVPNRGMARWLSFELADRLGICASIDFPTPNELLFDLFRRVLPEVPKGAAAGPDVTTWAIEAILRGRLDEKTFGPVSAYVRPGGKADPISDLRLHELSRKLAEVFEQYPLYRPQWVGKWDEGKCAIRGEDAIEQGRARDDLLADGKWQAELWRLLGESLPDTRWHFARLSKEFSAVLGQSDAARKLQSLPRRVFLFGTTSLAPSVIDALRGLGRHLDVRLFLLNPSRQLWSDIRSRREIARDKSGLAPVEGHRLLASLGTHVRELHELLVDQGDGFDPESPDFVDPGTTTLLHAIQSDILDVVQAERRVLHPEDDSIRLHVCHGPMREVEVLHDQLLAMFAADATLRPRDVVVLAPDIEAYAPAVQAVFADRKRTPADPPPLPFTIADRSLVSEQPVVSTFFDLLEIAGGRFEASSVLDLLECNALRRRIGLDDTAVDVAQKWVRDANVRWGVDESTADRLELPKRRENTWRFGLDRLFLGYAMSGEETWKAPSDDGIVVPHDEVEGTESLILGALSALVARLVRMDEEFRAPATAARWSERLSELHEDLFRPDADDGQAAVQLRRAIRAIGTNAKAAGHAAEIGLDVVRSELARLLSGPGRSGQFLAGSITFASLQPMRSVPFRVVCLLGLNSDVFPRVQRPQGFDLISRTKRIKGDRSRRDDDRYLFLEAILAARDRLYLSHVGLDERENKEIPPSVVVSELLDTILDGWTTEDAPSGEDPAAEAAARQSVLEHVRMVHPLQPFSRKYFDESVGDPRLFSYSRSMCEARNEADGSTTRASKPLVTSVLPPIESSGKPERDIEISEFLRFFEHPTKYFLRNRLDIRLDGPEVSLRDSEPLAVDALESFDLRRLILDGREDDGAKEDLRESFRAKGLLPPGSMGDLEFDTAWSTAQDIRAMVLEACNGSEPVRVPVHDLQVGDYRFTGFLERCADGLCVIDSRAGKVRRKDQMVLWIKHLLALASGRMGSSKFIGIEDTPFTLPALGEKEAARHLVELARLFDAGKSRPLRFFLNTSYEVANGKDGDSAWISTQFDPGESDDPWIKYAFRGADPRTDFPIEGDETFDSIARAIWGPLIEATRAAPRGGRRA